MSDTTEHYGPAQSVPDVQREPINPYFVVLWVVMVGCVVAGLFLLSVGSSLAGAEAHSFFPTNTGAGLTQIVWGGALLGLAVTTAIVMLGAAAARWERP